VIIIGIGSAGFKSLLVTCGVPWSEYRTSLLKKSPHMNIIEMGRVLSKEFSRALVASSRYFQIIEGGTYY
jgi:hypothetical protein